MPTKCRLLSPAEFRQADDERLALARRRDADPEWMKAHKYGWATLAEITGPAVMWFAPWLHDPKNGDDTADRVAALLRINKGEKPGYLSKFYWLSWSTIRAPIVVLCPNGREWCVDAMSSNGDGWTVSGDPPTITCTPSIAVPVYHGFLQNGVFTDDVEGRGISGT